MKQTVKKLLFMLGIMCLTIFGKETSTTVLADNLDEIENYTIYAEPDWEDGSSGFFSDHARRSPL